MSRLTTLAWHCDRPACSGACRTGCAGHGYESGQHAVRHHLGGVPALRRRARGAALGDAFAAIANDVSSLYYNPGGAALIAGPGAMVSTYDYVAETRYSWGGIAFPFSGGSRTFGLQIGTFGFDDQPVYTVDQPDGTGAVYSVSQTFAGATFAQNFSDRFSAGLTAKFVFDQLGDVNGTAFALDFGTNFHAMLSNHPIKLAFVVSNLGTDLKYSGDALAWPSRAIRPTPPPQPPELPQPASSRPRASRCRPYSGWRWPTTCSPARPTG